MVNLSNIKAENLDPIQLSLVSFGSLCGIGIGLLLSLIFISNLSKVIIAIIVLFLGISSIINHINHLIR